MWDGFESRKFPRVQADCLIFIKPLEGEPLSATTENIGAGGICTVLDRSLPKFSKVSIQLDLGDGEKPLVCDARIVWVVESRNLVTEKSTHDIGIEFLNLTEKDQERISRLIQSKINPL